MSHKRSCIPWFLFAVFTSLVVIIATFFLIPELAAGTFGPPTSHLTPGQRLNFGTRLLVHSNEMLTPCNPGGSDQVFSISPGESVYSVASRLEANGLIWDADLFSLFLAWTGSDTFIQTGNYRINPSQTGVEIAQLIVNSSMTEVTFSILPGWRLEEIAASLSLSGLGITPDKFLVLALSPRTFPDFIPIGTSLEGFLPPGQYILSRTTTTEDLLSLLLQEFSSEMTPDLHEGFSMHGLTIFQAVTLASIIQREAMIEDELPLLASVFYNRLAIGMALQSDPTVQYALGYNSTQGTWWTTSLELSDLQMNSPYNTYLYNGLPPGPISTPSLPALEAVANPATSGYYFFQASCDGSGRHNFAVTYEEHLGNNCQ